MTVNVRVGKSMDGNWWWVIVGTSTYRQQRNRIMWSELRDE